MRRIGERAQRHQRAGPGAGVEFCRYIAVRPGVRQQRRERGLRIGPAPRADSRLGPGQRPAPVGRGDKLGFDPLAGVGDGDHRVVFEADIAQQRFDEADAWRFIHGGDETVDQNIVFDIFAKSRKADFGSGEGDRGRLEPRARGVDHADFLKRRGLAAKPLPKPERLVKAQRRLEQRHGAAIGAAIGITDADHRKPGLRQGKGRGQSGRARSGDEDVGRHRRVKAFAGVN